jgi:hypothetical protein
MKPIIRPARYDEVARVWMNSWASVGIEAASDALLEKLRARLRTEVAGGWSLHVADDGGVIAAMLAPIVRGARVSGKEHGADAAGLHAKTSAG